MNYKSLADKIKAYLESLGFEKVNVFHTTGPRPVTISITFGVLEKNDNYPNFCIGLDRYCDGQRYNMNNDEFFMNEEQYARMIQKGVISDVDGYLRSNLDADTNVKSRIDGLHGRYFVVSLLPSIKK